MIHLIKNAKGKFDNPGVGKNGEYLQGTKQGFERRAGAIKNIRAQMKNLFQLPPDATILIQDDTGDKPVVLQLGYKTISKTELKPKKKYIPSKRGY